jgi:autotransporter adhesin
LTQTAQSITINNLQQGTDGPFRQNNTAGAAAPAALGANSIAGGFGTSATGDSAIAIGLGSSASGSESVAIGRNALAQNGSAVSIGSRNQASGNGAVAIGDPNNATGTGAVAIGANNTAIGNGTVALGNNSTANGNSAIALGQSANAAQAGNIAIGANASASGAGSAAIGENSNDGGQANVVAVGGTAPGTQRRVVNVAAGTVGASSNDAINGSQLYTLQVSIDTRFAQIGVGGPGLPYQLGPGSIAVGQNASAAQNGTAYGYGANASGIGSLASGNGAVAAGQNSVALGLGAQANASNSIALGFGSIADAPNTVSVGAPGAERRITNVAPGILPTDAATVGQLSPLYDGLNRVNRGLDRAYGGTALALAAGTVNLPLEVGEQGFTGAFGVYRYEPAFSFKYQARPSRNWSVGASVGVVTDTGDVGLSLGAGIKW